MNTKILIGAAVVALLITGGIWFFNNNKIKSDNKSKGPVNAFEFVNKLSPTQPATKPIVNTPAPQPTPPTTPAPTPVSPTPPANTVPANNDTPHVELLTYDVKDRELSKDNPVYLTVRATDNIGGVAKVEFYVNGHKEATATYRNLYIKSGSGDKVESATTKAADYVEDKYDEDGSNLGYTFRNYYKFDTQKSGCSVNEGYMIIMYGEKNLYDIHVSKDLNKVETCYKGTTINYNDTYTFMYKGGKGDYKFYVKTYDTYGAIDKTAEVKFSLK